MFFELLFIIFPILAAGLTFIFFLKHTKTRALDFPLDFGCKWRKKRLFGANKTIKGPFCMGFFSTIYGLFVFQLLKSHLNLNQLDCAVFINFLLIGFVYSLGELPNSFIKRQLTIMPGKTHPKKNFALIFKFIDTFDSLIFVGLGYIFLFNMRTEIVAISVLIGGFIHLLTDKLMTNMSLK